MSRSVEHGVGCLLLVGLCPGHCWRVPLRDKGVVVCSALADRQHRCMTSAYIPPVFFEHAGVTVYHVVRHEGFAFVGGDKIGEFVKLGRVMAVGSSFVWSINRTVRARAPGKRVCSTNATRQPTVTVLFGARTPVRN